MIWQLIDSSGVGGAERHVETLSGSLVRAGASVKIVLLADHGRNPWLKQLKAAGLDVTHLDGRFGALVSALRSSRPTLLHTHGYKAGILGRLAARLAGVPVVSTFHSGRRGAFPVGAYEALDDWTACLGHAIAVSPQIQARLPFRSELIPSYVVTPDAPESAQLPPVVAFVGRLSEEKGPETFCQLAIEARRRGTLQGVEWHVWGDGPMRADLEAAFGDVVQFHGVAVDMGLVWPRVGLLVMPSRFEGVPLAALEAAAHSIPVLAFRVGGLPTTVVDGETGWLCPPGDGAALLAGLDGWQLRRSTDTSELRRSCWMKARDDFSEARWLPRILAVYRSAGWEAARPNGVHFFVKSVNG